jgi:hypothetical protein
MLTPHVFRRAYLTVLQARIRFPRAEWLVAGVSVAAVAVFGLFVAHHASRVPYNDEYANLPIVYGEGVTFRSYWDQHNEHRIPLPKLVYVVAVRLAGYDVRGPVALNAVLLVGVTGYLLLVVRRLRGRTAVEDVFLPLTVLGVGAWENLVWGFQVQFVLSTVFALILLGLVVVPGFALSARRVGATGLLLALLPLCGANGLALVPAIGVGLGYVGLRNLWSGDRALRLPGVLALVGTAAGAAVLALYVVGLQKAGHHRPPLDLASVAASAVNFLGLAFGPVAHLMHAPGYDRPTMMGLAAVTVVAATAVLFLARLRIRDVCPRMVMVGCLLGGWLCLTAGIAYGRAGMGNLMGASRYITLAMPVLITVYLVWVGFGGRVGRRLVPAALALAVAAVWLPNTRHAQQAAGEHAFRMKRVEYQIRSGVPISFVTDGNRLVHPGGPEAFRNSAEFLRDHGQQPFALLQPDSPFRTESVPLVVVRTEGVEEVAGGYRVTGGLGTVVLALPAPRYAYGLALTYEAERPGTAVRSLVSWDRGGAAPPAPGCATLDQLMATDQPVTTRILVDREVDTLRIDLAGPDTLLKVHGLAVLSRVE